MKQIVFNSFPRSGNVYQSAISSHFFGTMNATVHMPEIFKIKEVNNVTIFRKPEDAIASLILKDNQENASVYLNRDYKIHVERYREYFKYAKINKDLIYIGKFNNLITDTVKHFENISEYFKMPLEKNYEFNFKKSQFTGNLWVDKYHGHMPRPKDSLRIEIEKNVSELPLIKELNKEYEDFIAEYATVV